MNFDFVAEEASDLHQVRLIAIDLRRESDEMEPERKRLMKEARLNGDDELHRLMSSVRPPAWYAIVSCDVCPADSLVSSNTPQASRFACTSCREPASLAWVEEDSLAKVNLMYEKYIDAQVNKVRRGDDGWTALAKRNHATSVKKNGCKVGIACEWCQEREMT